MTEQPSRTHCRTMLLALVATVLAAPLACKIPQTRYYSIEYPHASDAGASAPRISASMVVERFRGSDAYTTDRLAYRESEHEINFYEYHRWTSSPVEIATEAMLHTLKMRGRFNDVHSLRESERGDLILRGRVEHFEETDQPSVAARVELHLDVFEAKTRERLWSGHLETSEPVSDRTVPGIVAALDKSLKRCADALASQIEAALANYKARTESGEEP